PLLRAQGAGLLSAAQVETVVDGAEPPADGGNGGDGGAAADGGGGAESLAAGCGCQVSGNAAAAAVALLAAAAIRMSGRRARLAAECWRCWWRAHSASAAIATGAGRPGARTAGTATAEMPADPRAVTRARWPRCG